MIINTDARKPNGRVENILVFVFLTGRNQSSPGMKISLKRKTIICRRKIKTRQGKSLILQRSGKRACGRSFSWQSKINKMRGKTTSVRGRTLFVRLETTSVRGETISVRGKTFSRRGRDVALLKKKIVCPFLTLSIGTFSSRTGDKIFEIGVF